MSLSGSYAVLDIGGEPGRTEQSRDDLPGMPRLRAGQGGGHSLAPKECRPAQSRCAAEPRQALSARRWHRSELRWNLRVVREGCHPGHTMAACEKGTVHRSGHGLRRNLLAAVGFRIMAAGAGDDVACCVILVPDFFNRTNAAARYASPFGLPVFSKYLLLAAGEMEKGLESYRRAARKAPAGKRATAFRGAAGRAVAGHDAQRSGHSGVRGFAHEAGRIEGQCRPGAPGGPHDGYPGGRIGAHCGREGHPVARFPAGLRVGAGLCSRRRFRPTGSNTGYRS